MTTYERGRDFENLAVKHLEGLGYRVVTRNYRAEGGEIDIIAYEGDVLCFIEVRGRAADMFGHPFETIDGRKQKRIIKAARQYIATLERDWPPMRFDAIAIIDNAPIELIRGAFDTTAAVGTFVPR